MQRLKERAPLLRAFCAKGGTSTMVATRKTKMKGWASLPTYCTVHHDPRLIVTEPTPAATFAY